MSNEAKLLTTREAAEILGISKRTIYQWSWRNKHLHFVKVGRYLRISKKDLMEFIEKRRRAPESD